MTEKREKGKRRIINWFPRHVVPDELSVLSVYEIVAYILIFGICFHFYKLWNKIPVIDKDVYVERLDNKYDDAIFANVEYYIPNSSVFKDSIPHVYYYFSPYSKKEQVSRPTVLDSLANNYFKHNPLVQKGYHYGNTYYFGIEGKTKYDNYDKIPSKKTITAVQFDTVIGETNYYYSDNHYTNTRPVKIIGETFLHGGTKGGGSMDINDKELKVPHFFSGRDISQSYFIIRVHSYSIDSIILGLNFTGVTEITPLEDFQPMILTGDKIKYSFKPDYMTATADSSWQWINKDKFKYFVKTDTIGLTSIKMHVKFKDMENSQTRRVFLISTILSALITIFLAFIIIFFYRLFRLMTNKDNDNDE